MPNLLVAEFFIRNKHKRVNWGRAMKWSAFAATAFVAVVFVYSIAAASGTETGKYGRHLVKLFANLWQGG